MAYATEQIAQVLKAAREGKGLSQRALAKLAGVPQSHISKIENGGVDLRLSSLVEIARALDLEVTLVPQKNLSAVQSIVRSAERAAAPDLSHLSPARELQKLQESIGAALHDNPSIKELAQLQSGARDLQRLVATEVLNITTLREAEKAVEAFRKDATHLSDVRRALSQIREVRNAIVHAAPATGTVKPAYSLAEDDDG